jgi:hypothetical protein
MLECADRSGGGAWSLDPDKTEVHESVDLLGGLVVVEVVEFGALHEGISTLLFLMMSSSSSEPSSSSISGRSGGLISTRTSLSQSTDAKKECSLMADHPFAPSRFLGSRSSSPVMKDFAFSLTFLGNFSLPSLMFL